jgi:hypothetical protein
VRCRKLGTRTASSCSGKAGCDLFDALQKGQLPSVQRGSWCGRWRAAHARADVMSLVAEVGSFRQFSSFSSWRLPFAPRQPPCWPFSPLPHAARASSFVVTVSHRYAHPSRLVGESTQRRRAATSWTRMYLNRVEVETSPQRFLSKGGQGILVDMRCALYARVSTLDQQPENQLALPSGPTGGRFGGSARMIAAVGVPLASSYITAIAT